ncbi:MAG: hypothetical protein ABJA66_02500 [Actinomycetota bacterium]
MSQIPNSREKDLLELIKNICQRPGMYVGNSELKTVAAFIDGFASGAETYDEIREFSFWLAGELKLTRNVAWFCNLDKSFPNNETALEKLPVLFEEFRTAKENGWNFDSEYACEMKRIMIEGNKHK